MFYSPNTGSTDNRLLAGAICLLVIGSLVPIWSAAYFPSQNGPQFLLNVHMLKEFNNPTFDYHEYYTLNIRFIPHLLHNILVYLLSFAFPILVAHKVALSLYVLLLPLSVYYFLRAVAPQNVVYALVGFLYIYNFSFMRGYNNYTLSIPFFFFLFGYWVQHHNRLTIVQGLFVVLLTFVVCLGHLFSFLTFGLLAGVWAVMGRDRIRDLVKLAICTAPCLIMSVAYLQYSRRASVAFFDAGDTEYEYVQAMIENLLRKFLMTFSWPAAMIALVPVVIVLGLVLQRAIRYLWASRRGKTRALRALLTDRRFVITAVLVAFYFAMPYNFYGWHKVDTRIIPFIAIAMLACAAPLRNPTLRMSFVALTVAAALLVYGITAVYVRQLGEGVEERLAGIPKMERNAVILPLVLQKTKVGEILPYARLYDYYTMWNGGVTGNSIARLYNTIVPVVYKTYPVGDYLPLMSKKTVTRQAIRQMSKIYDYILVFGHKPHWESARDESPQQYRIWKSEFWNWRPNWVFRSKKRQQYYWPAISDLDAVDLELVFENENVRVYRSLGCGTAE